MPSRSLPIIWLGLRIPRLNLYPRYHYTGQEFSGVRSRLDFKTKQKTRPRICVREISNQAYYLTFFSSFFPSKFSIGVTPPARLLLNYYIYTYKWPREISQKTCPNLKTAPDRYIWRQATLSIVFLCHLSGPCLETEKMFTLNPVQKKRRKKCCLNAFLISHQM